MKLHREGSAPAACAAGLFYRNVKVRVMILVIAIVMVRVKWTVMVKGMWMYF